MRRFRLEACHALLGVAAWHFCYGIYLLVTTP
jgi:hypothetical protein